MKGSAQRRSDSMGSTLQLTLYSQRHTILAGLVERLRLGVLQTEMERLGTNTLHNRAARAGC